MCVAYSRYACLLRRTRASIGAYSMRKSAKAAIQSVPASASRWWKCIGITSASGRVLVLDAGGTPRIAFTLYECLPVKVRGPSLNAKDGTIAIEELQIVYAQMEVGPPDAGGSGLGIGVSADINRAAELYAHACTLGGALACSNLGALRARGRGVDRDPEEARRLFTRACEAGSAAGCDNLWRVAEPGL